MFNLRSSLILMRVHALAVKFYIQGTHCIECVLSIMQTQFEIACEEQNWTGPEVFNQFAQVLSGDVKVAWEETVENDYPQESDKTRQVHHALSQLRQCSRCHALLHGV